MRHVAMATVKGLCRARALQVQRCEPRLAGMGFNVLQQGPPYPPVQGIRHHVAQRQRGLRPQRKAHHRFVPVCAPRRSTRRGHPRGQVLGCLVGQPGCQDGSVIGMVEHAAVGDGLAGDRTGGFCRICPHRHDAKGFGGSVGGRHADAARDRPTSNTTSTA